MSDPSDSEQRIRGEVRIRKQLTRQLREIEIHVDGESASGMRVDSFMRLCCPSLSRSLFKHWITQGSLQHNGETAEAAAKIRQGDHLLLRAPLPPNPRDLQHHEPEALTIIHREDDFLVVDKPPGQLVHQAGRVFHGTLLGQIQDYLSERGADPLQARLVNRIDRETSGLVLVGLSAATQRALSKALESRHVEKTYLALCHGRPEPTHGHWREAIGPDEHGGPKRMIRADGQACHTEYQVIEERHGISLLRITLHTGRQHQIRLHAAHHGHPLVGDWIYGEACEGLPGQALHAHRLSFAHPHSGQALHVESPLHPAIAAIWEQCARGQPPQPRPLNAAEVLRRKNPDDGLRARRLPTWLSAEQAAEVRSEWQGAPE